MLNRLKQFWLAVTVPIDISECKTLSQARRWFDEAGVRDAKAAKSREELREVLLDTLADPDMSGTPVASVIRHYLGDQDALAGVTISSSDLDRRLYAEDLSQEDYDRAAEAYRRRERPSKRKKR